MGRGLSLECRKLDGEEGMSMKSASLWMIGLIWRLWWVLLTGVLVVTGASAETTATDGDWMFSYSDSDYTATMTKYMGTSATPSVPSKVVRRYNTGERDDDGDDIYAMRTYTVTAISRAFCENGIVTSVSMPSTITTLSGFWRCTNLVSISCSVPPKAIGSSAFMECHRFEGGIDLSQCMSIESHAFAYCDVLQFGNLVLSNITNLGAHAFSWSLGLTNVCIDGPNLSLTSSCFAYCSNLASVVVGNGVTSINASVFHEDKKLRTLDIGTGLTVVSSNLCENLWNLERVTFRGDIQHIETGAFYGCTNLISVSFGGTPKMIGDAAFSGCHRMKGSLDLSQCTSVGNSAFRFCEGLTSIDLSSCLEFLGDRAFQYCGGLISARIDGTDLTLPCYVLANCTNLQNVVIGDGVTGVIENTDHYDYSHGPFYGSPQLKTLEVGVGMTAISNYFCLGLSGLENATFRGNIQSVGNLAFSQCTNLVSISLGDSPKTIGNQAFYNCQKLEGNIDLSQCTNVGSQAFESCERLGGVVNLARCANVDNMAFYHCSTLAGVEFSSCLTNIGSSTFSGCSSLTSIELPTSLTSLGAAAFQNCSSLSNVWFKGSAPAVVSSPYGPFAGVASGARGYYPSSHRTEWKAVIGSDGKWQGLIMEEIPGPVLRVDSANPAEGSLTLAWDETATLEGVTYSVYRSAGESYSATDLVTNALTTTTWTDTEFSSVEPIQKPLNYWVVAEGGGYGERESNRVETRRRYALCVGINEYVEISKLRGCANDAIYMENNLVERGMWPSGNVTCLNDAGATKAAIRAGISNVTVCAVPGDTFLYFHSSHGGQFNMDITLEDPPVLTGEDGKAVFLCAYDEDYHDLELAADLGQFRSGVVVAVIVDACHSGGLFKNSARARAVVDGNSLDLARRVSILMDANRIQRKTRGLNVTNTISSSEIGWATAAEYYETSMDGGFYHSDEWMVDWAYATPYWSVDFKTFFYPSGWEPGSVFSASATWSWWNGTADTDAAVGDNDGFCDIYEFWKQGFDFCSRYGTFKWGDSRYNFHPQYLNADVLRRVELGVCKAGTGPVPMRTVRFNANGGNVSPSTKVVFQNDAIGEMPQPRRWGYDFSGWHTAAIGGSQVIESTTITASQTLYAHWMVNAEFSAWLERNAAKMLEANGGDYEAVAGAVAANGRSVWMCYLTGVSPEEKGADLKMVLQIGENGAWRVGWTPDLNLGGTKTERVYGVEAKRTMLDETWTDVTEVEDLDAAGWRFFRVRVEPPEE